jgi:hypothetical protein
VRVAIALVVSAAFGAFDQYLGSLEGSGHAWASGWSVEVSLLSAPWLLLPFLAGATQRDPKRGALLGLACTYAALLGYGLMTISPVENAHFTVATIRGVVYSQRQWFIGGLATGPLFGWFGQQWRSGKMLAGALLVAAALCLEPFASRLGANPVRYARVTVVEIAAGLLLAVAVLVRHRRHSA